jgi:ArsR family metal-binding transcriptional regulator
MSYLESIALAKTLPCLAEPGKVIVVGDPSRSLDEVLPFLAALPGVIAWNPEVLTLTFRRNPGFITLYSEKVTVTQVIDTQAGLEVLDALKDAINTTWEHRAELVAVTNRKRAPGHLDVYVLLPQTNCKAYPRPQCGEASCLAFAVLLVQQQHTLDECPPLQEDPAFTERRATLEAML